MRHATPALLAALLLAAPLPATGQLREFTGRVERVSGDTLVVANRMGDTMSFARAEATVVRGAKSSWSELASDDRVSVSWKFADEPRTAWVVRVHERGAGRP